MTLPALLLFDGNWPAYVENLYSVYMQQIVNGNLTFKGLRISCQYRPASQDKHYGFWHVVSEGEIEEDRIPDIRRCERISWIAYLISQVDSNPDISWWENKRGRDSHVVIWHEAENFVVILAKRSDYYLLKSAYCPETKRKAKFIAERAKYLASLC